MPSKPLSIYRSLDDDWPRVIGIGNNVNPCWNHVAIYWCSLHIYPILDEIVYSLALVDILNRHANCLDVEAIPPFRKNMKARDKTG